MNLYIHSIWGHVYCTYLRLLTMNNLWHVCLQTLLQTSVDHHSLVSAKLVLPDSPLFDVPCVLRPSCSPDLWPGDSCPAVAGALGCRSLWAWRSVVNCWLEPVEEIILSTHPYTSQNQWNSNYAWRIYLGNHLLVYNLLKLRISLQPLKTSCLTLGPFPSTKQTQFED